MNTITLAIVLMSGYLYVINSVSTRYIFKRSQGWDAYFYVALWGVMFTLLSWLLCSFLSMFGFFRWLCNFLLVQNFVEPGSINRFYPLSTEEQFKFSDVKYGFFCFTSLFLAWASGHFMRWYVYCDQDRLISVLVEAIQHDPFESFLVEASISRFPVIVTLASRKFYVGIVNCPELEQGKVDYLQLLLLLSGYRDKDTLTITVTTNYKRHYIESGLVGGISEGTVSFEDFRTLLPKGKIEGMSFLDIHTYSQFKAKEDDRSGSSTTSPTSMPHVIG